MRTRSKSHHTFRTQTPLESRPPSTQLKLPLKKSDILASENPQTSTFFVSHLKSNYLKVKEASDPFNRTYTATNNAESYSKERFNIFQSQVNITTRPQTNLNKERRMSNRSESSILLEDIELPKIKTSVTNDTTKKIYQSNHYTTLINSASKNISIKSTNYFKVKPEVPLIYFNNATTFNQTMINFNDQSNKKVIIKKHDRSLTVRHKTPIQARFKLRIVPTNVNFGIKTKTWITERKSCKIQSSNALMTKFFGINKAKFTS